MAQPNIKFANARGNNLRGDDVSDTSIEPGSPGDSSSSSAGTSTPRVSAIGGHNRRTGGNNNINSDNDAAIEPRPDVGGNNDAASITSEESFTFRDRQNAINTAHPFGIRIWKPALYKKNRSVNKNADEDIHSKPNRYVPASVQLGNVVWSLTFGLVLFLACTIVWLPLRIPATFSSDAVRYGGLVRQLSLFFLDPFGKYVQLIYNDHYRGEDDGHGRPLADYLAWQQSSDGGEQPSRLFFAPRRRRPSQHFDATEAHRVRLFGRGNWSAGRILFYTGYYLVLVPVGVVVAIVCWLTVFGVPMARVIAHLLYHIRIHPLALAVKPTSDLIDAEAQVESPENYSVLFCTYRAFGLKYYKYTVDGTNVMLLNLVAVVFVTLGDFYLLHVFPEWLQFALSLVSIVPLAHFIGQAVASISAQSSMSMGATINAFFSTIVEVYLYLVALRQGKGELVEGSITGSVLAGVLLMPGLSMCAGALYRKTLKFNPKSAGATSTMLMFTLVGVLAPTIFYSLYGPSEVRCEIDPRTGMPLCWNSTMPLRADDEAYQQIIKPFGQLCAVCLFVAYAIGLWFTLRTHAAMIWTAAPAAEEQQEEPNSEEGPNWGRRKSYIILLSATLLYAMIAEVLVDRVDIVLENVNISPRMLGITVFALVPNTTEFLNAISFAMYGNVSLSLEIGGAYALQVCLLQIPALVLFSQQNVPKHLGEALRDYAFILLFPRWDTWAWIVCVLLFTHVHAEGRSNYFKGSIMLLAYLVLVLGFYFNDKIYDILPVPMDRMAQALSSSAHHAGSLVRQDL